MTFAIQSISDVKTRVISAYVTIQYGLKYRKNGVFGRQPLKKKTGRPKGVYSTGPFGGKTGNPNVGDEKKEDGSTKKGKNKKKGWRYGKMTVNFETENMDCLLYTSPSPRDS